MPNSFGRPLIEALTVSGRSDGGGFVRGGSDPQGERAGEVLARLDSILGTGIEKYPKGNLPIAPQSIHITGAKIRAPKSQAKTTRVCPRE